MGIKSKVLKRVQICIHRPCHPHPNADKYMENLPTQKTSCLLFFFRSHSRVTFDKLLLPNKNNTLVIIIVCTIVNTTPATQLYLFFCLVETREISENVFIKYNLSYNHRNQILKL